MSDPNWLGVVVPTLFSGGIAGILKVVLDARGKAKNPVTSDEAAKAAALTSVQSSGLDKATTDALLSALKRLGDVEQAQEDQAEVLQLVGNENRLLVLRDDAHFEYEDALIDHIDQRLPPPAPARASLIRKRYQRPPNVPNL